MSSAVLKKKETTKISALGLVEPPPIHIESPVFKGSLALLFECVRDRKVDLLGIPLAPICETYFHYLLEHQDTSVDTAAAALNALSYLVERKSWMLLPVPDPEPEEDDPLELLDPTVHEYQEVIELLRSLHEDREQVFFRQFERSVDVYEVPTHLSEITPQDLARAFERILKQAVPPEPEVLQKPRKSLAAQMKLVLTYLTRDWADLSVAFRPPYTPEEAVVSFLAVLELIRLGTVKMRKQEESIQIALAH